MGQTLKPLEGVVDEDPVLVGLASVIVRGGSCNKKHQTEQKLEEEFR